MLIRSLSILLFLFLGNSTLKAQDVDLKAMQAKYPSKDIVYLNYDTEIFVDLVDGELKILETITERKLLLTKNAKLYREESIPYYSSNRITEIKAQCKIPSGKRFKVKDFEEIETISEKYFYDDSHVIKFEYPNIVEGAICELSYTRQIDNPIFTPSVFLASYIPIEEINIKVVSHKDIELLFHQFNVDPPVVFSEAKKGDKLIRELRISNIKDLDFEPRGKSFRAMTPHINMTIGSYTVDGKKTEVMANLDNLFDHYSGFISKVDTMVNQDFRDHVSALTADATTDIEKTKLIYNWVKSNIKYVAFEDNMGGFVPRNPQQIFERKFGDCKDMTSIIVKMMEVAGLNCHYAWVGTRDLPYTYSNACGVFIDNHMIAAYHSESDDQYYFLDATNSYLSFGLVPPAIQEKQVMLYLTPSEYEIVDANINNCSNNLNFESCQLSIEGDDLVGSFDIKLDGYDIPEYKYIFQEMNKEKLEKRFQTYFAKGSNKSSLSAIETKHDSEPIQIKYDITIGDYVSKTDDEIYVNMNLDKVFEGHKMSSHRKQAIDMHRTHNIQKEYSIAIPEGYNVTYLPEDASFGTDDYKCSIKYTKDIENVKYQLDICTNTLWIQPSEFDDWNNFIKNLKKSYRENIIFSKK